MQHVFLSYSEADSDTAQRIRDHLSANDLTTWIEDSEVQRTLSPQDMYEAAIRESGCVVVILSPNARQSRRVREQSQFALKIGLPVIPILVSGQKLDSTPDVLNNVEWIDASRDFDQAMRELVTGIRGRLNIKGAFARRLDYWNPVHQFIMLGWVFFAPNQLLNYRAYAGEKSARITGSWMMSLITWMPLLIATISFAVSRSNSQTGVVFGIVLLVGWFFTAMIGPIQDDGIGVMVAVGVFFLTMALTFALSGGGWQIGAALIPASIIAAGVGHIVAGDVARNISLGAAIGTTVGAATSQANVVLGGVVVGIAFAAGILVAYLLTMRVVAVLRRDFEARQSSSLSKAIFVVWVLSYVFIIGALLISP